ncbi:hypothetical protein [Paracoccus sp. MC1862]|uniref:hypothetical protein n=1 Tax=Paracoccus sp. MC1862 TaxID=2760307 RepID=UPI001603E263|nr:hypothetical protein [Paracoccus sp. MC1862]MBB1499762.1 hypothetical protein [Paracoccus sp. MC1862]QQO45779.1 hypothetical protein JGR78_05485 [Paracoccus sp. MC1862]
MAIKARGSRGKLSLYKRVPARYGAIAPCKFVWVALHTDSPRLAERKADAVWSEMIEAWEAKLAGDATDAEQRFQAARNLAIARGTGVPVPAGEQGSAGASMDLSRFCSGQVLMSGSPLFEGHG